MNTLCPLFSMRPSDTTDAQWTSYGRSLCNGFQCVHCSQRALNGRPLCSLNETNKTNWFKNDSAMIVSRMIVLMNTIKWTQWTSIVSNVSMAMGHVHWIDTACLHSALSTDHQWTSSTILCNLQWARLTRSHSYRTFYLFLLKIVGLVFHNSFIYNKNWVFWLQIQERILCISTIWNLHCIITLETLSVSV